MVAGPETPNKRPETVSRILDGAISALARQGPKKFSMSDICEEAGIARGTLYRYFRNKDEILESLGDHVTGQLAAALQEGIEARPELDHRVVVVMDSMTAFWTGHPELVLLGKLEPGFVLQYIERTIPGFKPMLHNFLDPVLSRSELVKSRVATEEQIIDLLLRVVFSYYYMPMADESDRSAAWNILDTLAAPAGAGTANRRRKLAS